MRAADFLEPNGSSLSVALSPVLVRLIGRYSCNRIAPRCLWLLTLAFVRAIGRVSCNRIALVALGIGFGPWERPTICATASTLANWICLPPAVVRAFSRFYWNCGPLGVFAALINEHLVL